MDNKETYDKFHALDLDKQEKIINAAMKEFLQGYKKASTDNIVKEAGISKGILFHYFGTKEKLYHYLIDRSVSTNIDEFLGRISTNHTDFLDSIWEMAVIKGELSRKYPSLFDFLAAVYLDPDSNATVTNASLAKMMEKRNVIMTEIYASANFELFRPDLPPLDIINIINWAIDGYATHLTRLASASDIGELARINYEHYLEELQKMIHIFRTCFYRQ